VQATKTILGGVRDVKIVDVIPAATEIYKHRALDVSVVVTNEGTEVETFNVTLFFSEIHGWHLIDVDGRLAWYSDAGNSADFLLQTSVMIPADNPTMTFETKYDTENLYDFCFVQISTDEGATWVSLENAYTTHSHAADTEPEIVANLPGLTGTSVGWPGWGTMSFDLSAYAGQTVLLGFRYMTDSAYAKEGWYVDNVAINGEIVSNQDFTQQNPPSLNPILTLSVSDLAPSTQRTLTFSVNTSNIPTGEYSVSARASPVQAEIDTQDNFYADGVVEVMINPDVDGDGDVDIFDVVAVASIYGCKEGDARWNPKVDLVEDKVINIFDVVVVAGHYGEKIP
jgi:hypothetical protein